MAQKRNRPALLLGVLAFLALSLLALRGGSFDPPAPAGLVQNPCPAVASTHAQVVFSAISGRAERQMMRDWGNLCRYRHDNAAVIARGPARAVLIGDSITERWQGAAPELFANGLVNRGISGQTSPKVLLRFYPDAIALHPRVIHLLIGVNDIGGFHGATTVEAIQTNFRAMADLAASNRTALVLGSITPVRESDEILAKDAVRQIAEFNHWLRAFAAERKLVFADYHAALSESDGRLKASFTDDGIHLNAAGYAAMQPVLEQALRQAEAKAP